MKNRLKIIVVCFLLLLFFLLGQTDYVPLKLATTHFRHFFFEMLLFLPCMFVLIGLVDAWLPRSIIEPYIGKSSGFKGSFWIILFAMLQAGPLYGAFPVSVLLWEKGASIRNIFLYLGAFSTLKIPMLTFETGFMGWQFTLLRTLVTLPLFVLIAFLMEFILKKTNFSVVNPKV